MSKSSRRDIWILVWGLLFVAAIVIFVLLIVFWPKERYETILGEGEDSSIASLVCKASNPTEAFFRGDKAENPLYVIKASYDGDQLSSISFNYSAKFESEEEARSVSSKMVSDYDEYVVAHGLELSTYYPNFRNLDDEVRIDLYSDAKNLTLTFNKLILSDSSTDGTFAKKSYKDMKKIFESYGYRCEYSE